MSGRTRAAGEDAMLNTRLALLLIPAAAFAAAGCEATKSANPTSPSVAGAIAGVNISAPSPVSPMQGTTIPAKNQPVTLTVQNATTNGQRPITYRFEVAADADFNTKVAGREGIAPGSDGKTSYQLPDALAADRTYYWRAKALDGANESSYSQAVSFAVVTLAELQPPVPISPVSGLTTSSRSPEFKTRNAVRSGPVGAVSYTFEIAEDLAFSAMVAIVTMPEQAAETKFTVAQQLKASTKHFWRVRAFDSNTASAWSLTQSFVTPAAVVTPPPPPPPPTGGLCNSTNPDTIVKCERAKYGYMSSSQTLDFLRASAKSLNRNSISGAPFGLLRKDGGMSCGGYACDIICAGQGTSQRQYDVLGDAEGAQIAGWGSAKTYPDIRVDVCEIQ
jgi:hypothetical protein